MARRWLGAAVPLVLVLGWEALWHLPGQRLESISHPTDVARAFVTMAGDGSLLRATLETFQAAALGFAIAALLGIALGVVLGLAPRLERMVGPSVDAMRPVPSVALIPIALMLFGFGINMEAVVIAFACFWPVLLVTIAAVRGIDPRLLEVARVLELPVPQRMLKIILPAALARIAVGLRLALAIALVVAVTVEIVINPRGLGHAMMSAQQALRFDEMYAQLVWIGVVGWGVSVAAEKLLRGPGAASGAAGAPA
jgi:ABC-type nitrate/sulfonate/bicarbonate transport system permease component